MSQLLSKVTVTSCRSSAGILHGCLQQDGAPSHTARNTSTYLRCGNVASRHVYQASHVTPKQHPLSFSSRSPLLQLGGLGECCELTLQGLGQSPIRNFLSFLVVMGARVTIFINCAFFKCHSLLLLKGIQCTYSLCNGLWWYQQAMAE